MTIIGLLLVTTALFTFLLFILLIVLALISGGSAVNHARAKNDLKKIKRQIEDSDEED